ncbi:MAG: cyclic nucleotide-binding domain-containing protein [Planctomycetota bacterium]
MERSDKAALRPWDAWIAVCATVGAIHASADVVLDLSRASRVAFDSFLSAMLLADFVARLRRKDAAGSSRSGGLLADLLSATPFALLLGPTPFQLLRLLKLSRVAQLLGEWRSREIRHAAALRLVFFVYWFVLVTHVVACCWIALRGPEGSPGGGSRYVSALYWAVTTLATVGYGDVTPSNDAQRLFAILVMLLGVGTYGFIIGNIASILANLDPGRASFLHRMEQLSAFMAYRKIPPDLQERIGDYYRYAWRERLEHDESKLLEQLPPALRTAVALHLKRDLVEAVPLFRGASESFLREIALEMKPSLFLPGDTVIRAGERGREMYFISRGSVEVVAPDDTTVLGRLSAGDFFGEIALVYETPRTATVRALDYCDLYRLEKELFDRVLTHHPEIAQEIRVRAKERRGEA